MLLDIRTLPGDNQKILEAVEAIAKRLSSGKRTYTVKIKNNLPAVTTDPKSAIVKETIRLKQKLHGFTDPLLRGSGPANESYMLVEAGIPTIVGFGAVGEGFHSADEYAEIDSISKSLEFLVALSKNIAK